MLTELRQASRRQNETKRSHLATQEEAALMDATIEHPALQRRSRVKWEGTALSFPLLKIVFKLKTRFTHFQGRHLLDLLSGSVGFPDINRLHLVGEHTYFQYNLYYKNKEDILCPLHTDCNPTRMQITTSSFKKASFF